MQSSNIKKSLAALLLSCTPFLNAQTHTLYMAAGGGEKAGVYQASFDSEKGQLSKPEQVATLDAAGFIAQHPKNSVLYVVGSEKKQPILAAYKITEKGQLTPLDQELLNDGGAAHLAVHPSGRFLATAQYGGNSVSIYSLDESGIIKSRIQHIEYTGASMANPKRQRQPHPHWVGYSPDGQHALVVDLGKDVVTVYKIGANDKWQQANEIAIKAGSGPRHLKFTPDGKNVYLLNELSLTVSAFAYDADTGNLRPIDQDVETLTELEKVGDLQHKASEIRIHPSGHYVYTANRGHDSITVFRRNLEGKLVRVEVEPIRGAWPRNFNLTPDGNWLIAAGADSNTLSVFKVDDKTGELQFKTHAVQNMPNPICVFFSH
ncbi:lactonase family protein [Gayadomonas joobiniege]|uniref:lactonase family protein n=1 Tax=Gayadomonas joobiniege TaxID=1234606 RepID=UPI0003775083|nr:lactonase family protein [Gayadomonas joobiniege]